MTPALSGALQLVVEGDPHSDLPAAIERLGADDQRMVRYLLDAQGKRIDRERRDAALEARARALSEAAIWGAARQGLP